MSVAERNRFLQILHRNKATRDQIEKILADTKHLFEEEDVDDYDDLEGISDYIFNNDNRTESDIQSLIHKSFLKVPLSEDLATKNKSIFDKKFLDKQREIEIYEGRFSENEEEVLEGENEVFRYGRSPLHQAIISGDLETAKEYIKKGLYLESVDNSGLTPRELAYYMGYKEALALFK